MSTKLTDPNDFLFEMEEPIRAARGAVESLASIGASRCVTAESINFMADALLPEVKRLEELWGQWAKLQRGAGEREG
jgi:hypothetical protein